MAGIKLVKINKPAEVNVILGQSHFIKTVEDIYEVLAASMPAAKFGLAFAEASGVCKVRSEGTDPGLKALAEENIMALRAGHSFIILLRDAYPINVLNAIKNIPEVCSIYCASANPVEAVVFEGGAGCGILGVIDGASPKGVESEEDIAWRHELLRKIGYKL